MSEETVMMQFFDDEEPHPVPVSELIDPGLPRATKTARAKRMSICNECPNLIEGVTCGNPDGFFVQQKTWVKEMVCPEGKW